MPYYHADCYNELIKRKCTCGGDPEMILDPVGDYVVRCKECHISTHAYMEPETAAARWDAGNDIMPPFDLLIDDLDKALAGEVLYIAIPEEDSEQLNQQSCDCYELVIVMRDRILWATHEENGESGAIGLDHLSLFNEELYNLRVNAPPDGPFEFMKVLYGEDGALDGIKFRFGDRYLFIFADEHNLIVTKSVVDLSFEDVPAVPWNEDSVLFE